MIGVSVIEETLIKSNLAARPAVKNVFCQFVDCFQVTEFHRLTNGILSLDIRQGLAAHSEVFCHHTEVKVPSFVISNGLVIARLKCKSCDIVRQLVLCKNLRWLLNRIVLIVYHTNNHALEYQICLCRVSMGRCEQTISERVIAVIKLRDVAPKVLLYGEFASWVDFFIAIRSQD